MTVRQTSADTYHSPSFQSAAHSDCEIIKQLVRQRGPMTRRQIASFLHMETSSVSGRVHELVEDGILIELDELRPCPETGRRVTWLSHHEHCVGFQMGMVL